MRTHIICNAALGKFIAAFVIITVLLHGTSPAEAPEQPASEPQQTNQEKSEHKQGASVELNKEYFIGYWTDTKNIVTAPARWDSTDWLTAGIVTGIAVGLYTQDDHIKRRVQENKNDTTSNTSDVARKIGAASVPLLIGLGAYGYIADDGKAKKTFLLSTESFIITGIFVQFLKHATGRSRPGTGDPHDTWSGWTPSGQNDHLSFPSGDASSAFAVASVVASEYSNRWVPPLVYTASTLIGLSRVYSNGHWSSDVFVGSAIGYFTGKAIVASHKDGKESTLSMIPIIDGKDVGFLVNYRY